MSLRLRRGLPGLVVAACAVLAGAPEALAASRTNAQLLYGWGFDDIFFGDRSTENETLTTLTLEHFGTWRYGANFFFFDVMHGDFLTPAGEPAGRTVGMYGEATTRLSIPKILGREGVGWLGDVYAAAELDAGGDGFWAGLAGLGAEFALPANLFVGLTLSYRNDRFNGGTFQVTSYWGLPFALGPVPLVFTGYIDVAGTDGAGADVNTQPQLLLDVGALAGGTPDRLQVGTEWYLHFNDIVSTSAPQAMLKWIW